MERNVNFRCEPSGREFCVNRYNGAILIENVARVPTQKLAEGLRDRFEEIYRLGYDHGKEESQLSNISKKSAGK